MVSQARRRNRVAAGRIAKRAVTLREQQQPRAGSSDGRIGLEAASSRAAQAVSDGITDRTPQGCGSEAPERRLSPQGATHAAAPLSILKGRLLCTDVGRKLCVFCHEADPRVSPCPNQIRVPGGRRDSYQRFIRSWPEYSACASCPGQTAGTRSPVTSRPISLATSRPCGRGDTFRESGEAVAQGLRTMAVLARVGSESVEPDRSAH